VRANRCFFPRISHAFEIIPSTFQILKKNTDGLDRVSSNPFGPSDHDGNTVAYAHPTASELATTTSGGPAIHHTDFTQLEVQVRTGDAYCREQAIQKINFLKIDAEGAEGAILAGFSQMLDQNSIEVIQFEYGMANIYSRFLLKDFYSLLSSKGFLIGKLFPRGVRFQPYNPEMEDFRGPNFVAVYQTKPELVKLLAET
jgi:FkbM family methyltransferase